MTAEIQPDIHYQPSFSNYAARTARRPATEDLPTTLPEGFPTELNSPLAWKGADFTGERKDEWVYSFSDAELDEIDSALQHFQSLGKAPGFLSPDTFPLPTVHAVLRQLSADLHHTRGFLVLRGLRIDAYTREQNIIIYAGISSHIASERGRQDHQSYGKPADVTLTHIKDLSATSAAGLVGAPAYTADAQVFHTDQGADIVSLCCLGEAAEGGVSQVASSWAVYNELARTRPDLIHTLSKDWVLDGFNNPDQPFTKRPLLFQQPPTPTTPQRVILSYARRVFTGYGALPRTPTIPPITEAQAEALDALHFIAEKVHLPLEFRKGDVQYINNLSVFHARTAYRDDDKNQRHLLRIWCRDPENAWAIPEELMPRWKSVFGGVAPETEVLQIDPQVRSASNSKKAKASDDQ